MELFARPVQRYMTPNVRAVFPDTTLEEARLRLEEWRISCVAVVDLVDEQYQLRGVVSLTDLVRAGNMRNRPDRSAELILPSAPVTAIMTTEVVRVRISFSAASMRWRYRCTMARAAWVLAG